MRDIHLSLELLRAVARGDVRPRTLIDMGLEHLRTLCPTCDEEWRAWNRQRAGELAERPLPRSPETFGAVLAGLLPRLQKQAAAAARDFGDLLDLPDAALDSLDLAELYLRAGRSRETRRLAQEVAPILVAQDLRPEALAALRVLTQAC
jgi:hypothetical protein